MKTLDSAALGGMPLEGNDLTWMTNGNLEAFKAIMDAFILPGEASFIITGCVASISGASNVAISAGVAYIADRIRPISGVILTPPFANPEIDSDVIFDPLGNETFEDGVVRSTYRNEYAFLASAGGTLTRTQFIDAVNNLPRMKSGWTLNSQIENWLTLPVSSPFITPAPGYDIGGFTPLQYRRMIGNRIELSGSFYHPIGSTSSIAILPVGYRPNKRIYLPTLTNGSNGTPREQSLRIDPDGTMRLGDGHTLTVAGYFGVDGLSFPINRGI